MKSIDNTMSTTLLYINIGFEIVHILEYIISVLEQLRSETEVTNFRKLLSVLIWAVTFFKFFIEMPTIMVTEFYRTGFGKKVDFLVSMVLGCAPNSVYCFNKTGYFIFFLDFYFMLYAI